jgi:anti-sigma factor RsiW
MLDWHGDVAVVLRAAETGRTAGGIKKMNEEQQLKLQAFLDGELPAGEAREIAALVQRDAAAAALLAELKTTRAALAGAEPAASVPETREFYWSKIEREIRKLDPVESRRAAPLVSWRRLLWPISAAAVCFALVMIETSRMNQPEAVAAVSADTDAPIVEPAQAGSEAITYQDKADNTTLVWFAKSDDSFTPAQTPAATF